MLSALIAAEEAGELLTDAELRSMVITLMSAGQGTVQHQLGNAMSAFMSHPQQWRLLAAEPGLAAQATDEVVRFCPSALLGLPRTTHLTYGGGIHYCLGAALARAELQEALPRLASRLREPCPAGPGEWLPPTEAVYGPLRLPIRYRPS